MVRCRARALHTTADVCTASHWALSFSYLHYVAHPGTAALLVFDITDVDSFSRVKSWVKELRQMAGATSQHGHGLYCLCLCVGSNALSVARMQEKTSHLC